MEACIGNKYLKINSFVVGRITQFLIIPLFSSFEGHSFLLIDVFAFGVCFEIVKNFGCIFNIGSWKGFNAAFEAYIRYIPIWYLSCMCRTCMLLFSLILGTVSCFTYTIWALLAIRKVGNVSNIFSGMSIIVPRSYSTYTCKGNVHW